VSASGQGRFGDVQLSGEIMMKFTKMDIAGLISIGFILGILLCEAAG